MGTEVPDLMPALKAACRWLTRDMYTQHIKPERIDVAEMRKNNFSPEYISDVLTIRRALGKR